MKPSKFIAATYQWSIHGHIWARQPNKETDRERQREREREKNKITMRETQNILARDPKQCEGIEEILKDIKKLMFMMMVMV